MWYLLRKPLIRRDKGDILSLHFLFKLLAFASLRSFCSLDIPGMGMGMCVCVCVCVFIKLHITAQSGPVILVILCHSH